MEACGLLANFETRQARHSFALHLLSETGKTTPARKNRRDDGESQGKEKRNVRMPQQGKKSERKGATDDHEEGAYLPIQTQSRRDVRKLVRKQESPEWRLPFGRGKRIVFRAWRATQANGRSQPPVSGQDPAHQALGTIRWPVRNRNETRQRHYCCVINAISPSTFWTPMRTISRGSGHVFLHA